MSIENKQDAAEPSPASDGSVLVDIVDRLCGWRDEHGFPTPGEIMDEAVSEIRQLRGSLEWHKETLVEAEEKMVRMQLTDAERTAIERPRSTAANKGGGTHERRE